MEKLRGLLRVCETAAAKAFPERQIYFRTDAKVRLVRVSPLQQILATAGVIALATGLTLVSVTAAVRNFELNQRERRVEAVEGDISQMASRIESRQQLLLDLLNRRLQAEDAGEGADKGNATETAALDLDLGPGLSDATIELHRYRSYEQQQLELIRSASLAAETRIRETEAMLKRLGLNSGKLVGQSPANLQAISPADPSIGLGGPLIDAALSEKALGGSFEEPLRKLISSWHRLDSLERASLSLPAIVPVKSYRSSSGYGYRHDPFTGRGAFHNGVDLAGRHGEPVVAAAGGVVTRAAYWGAYGRVVEIDHGRGLVTRYGHLSAIKARAGERVAPGTVIGLMGSSGRSTGTHLHYEVRFEDRALNPVLFLKAADDLLAIQKRAQQAQG